ncbi:MAG: hypothetical protein FWF46_07410 [Oscillospiraceae bacterium]|nr:hypothetical protein [Oscillospiraceae bacterium]
MELNAILKKEGISSIEQLSTLKVNIISNNIATKLCTAFPEHGFDKAILFANLSRLTMYLADIPDSLCMAKYFSENNFIYFNKNLDLNDLDTIALHECIHYLQEEQNPFGKVRRFGLATFGKNPVGIALNEAAVQLMAAEANGNKEDLVTYYNITLPSNSPTYYTLESVLLKQIAYFTGTYPLYHSTLFSNDIFKNTIINKTSKTLFNIIQNNFDKLVKLEDNLNELTIMLQNSDDNFTSLKTINKRIEIKKEEIFNLFLKTQNIIMTNCFNSEFKNIKTIAELRTFKAKLYNYQHLIGISPNYTFYKDFYCFTMNKLEEKEAYIQSHNYKQSISTAMVLFETNESIFHFMKTFFKKLFKLPSVNREKVDA